METQTIYNMALATHIETTENPDGSVTIDVFFGPKRVPFMYGDKEKAKEVISALSKFRGTLVQKDQSITINVD